MVKQQQDAMEPFDTFDTSYNHHSIALHTCRIRNLHNRYHSAVSSTFPFEHVKIVSVISVLSSSSLQQRDPQDTANAEQEIKCHSNLFLLPCLLTMECHFPPPLCPS